MQSVAGSSDSHEERNSASRVWLLSGAFLGIFIGLHSIHAYTLGLFIPSLEDEFGWTRAQASAGAAISFLGIGLGAPIAGRYLDRYGSRPVAAFSLLGMAGAFVCLSQLTEGFSSFLALSFLLCIVGAGTGTYTFTRLVVLNFKEKRGLALGGVLTATGFGGALYPYLLIPLVAEHGWRVGYLAVAAIILVATPIVLYLIGRGGGSRTALETAKNEAGYGRYLMTPTFVILSLMFFVSAFATLGTTVHFASLLFDKGWSVAHAAQTAALIGWGAIAARVAVGFLLDRFNPPRVTACVFLLCAVGMALLRIGGDGFVVLGAILAGVAIGTEGDLLAFMVARYFPLKFYGSVLGIIFLVFNFGAAAGPLASGYLRDIHGNYETWLTVACGCFLVSAALVSFLRSTPEATAR